MTKQSRADATCTLRMLALALLWAAVGPLPFLRAEVGNPHGVAVIVGNRTYGNDIPEVSYAHRDAEAFKRYVIDVLGFDERKVIDLRDARRKDLESVLGDDRTHRRKLWGGLDPEGTSDEVVYYSGHGVPGLNDRRGYLLPSDARPEDAERDGYAIDLLYENLGKLQKARSVTVYLDACFFGRQPPRGEFDQRIAGVHTTGIAGGDRRAADSIGGSNGEAGSVMGRGGEARAVHAPSVGRAVRGR